MTPLPLRVRLGATQRHTIVLDGYPVGAPTLSLTLPDGSAWAPDAGVPPVHAERAVSAIAADRRTLTLSASVDVDGTSGDAGDVYVLLGGTPFARRLREAKGTRAVLAEPLPGTETPDSIAWARHTFLTDPADDGPGSVAGVLDGTLTYTIVEDGGEREHVRALSLDVEARVFWTGLTVHVLHARTAGITAAHGGNTAETESRYGDYQGPIESTMERLRLMVESRIRASARVATVVSGTRFLEPHLLMVRAELATDATRRDELLREASDLIDLIVEALPVDSDGDGVVDGEVAGGYRSPAALGYGLPTTRTFSRGMTR